MIAFVYVVIIIGVIYLISSFVKPASQRSGNPDAILEAVPENLPVPIYRPFRDGPFQMTMGLQSLNKKDWIQIDRNYRKYIQLKKTLLNSERRAELFFHKDEAYAASMELLKMLIDYLPYQYPNMFQRNHSRTKIINRITGDTFSIIDRNPMHPLEIASLLVQEDLVIMQQNSGEDIYYANALSVCFPSVWAPKTKFGLSLAAVHTPHVPFFDEKLRPSVNRYFLKIKEDNPVQRLNWTLQIGGELCLVKADEKLRQPITKDNAGQLIYVRIERQTLVRLPISNTLVFTIKTYLTKMDDLCRNDPSVAQQLAGAIRNWPPEIIKYKDADRYLEGLVEYLDIMSNV